MTNFLSRFTNWFQPQPVKKKQVLCPKLTKIRPKSFKNPASIPPTPANKSFNTKPYRQLIGKLAKIAIATQRERQRRKDE